MILYELEKIHIKPEEGMQRSYGHKEKVPLYCLRGILGRGHLKINQPVGFGLLRAVLSLGFYWPRGAWC